MSLSESSGFNELTEICESNKLTYDCAKVLFF